MPRCKRTAGYQGAMASRLGKPRAPRLGVTKLGAGGLNRHRARELGKRDGAAAKHCCHNLAAGCTFLPAELARSGIDGPQLGGAA